MTRKFLLLLLGLPLLGGCFHTGQFVQSAVPTTTIPNLPQIPICRSVNLNFTRAASLEPLTAPDVVVFEMREYRDVPNSVAVFLIRGSYSERDLFSVERTAEGRMYWRMTKRPVCYFVVNRGLLSFSGKTIRPVGGLVPSERYTGWAVALDYQGRAAGEKRVFNFRVRESMRGVMMPLYSYSRVAVHQRQSIPHVRMSGARGLPLRFIIR